MTRRTGGTQLEPKIVEECRLCYNLATLQGGYLDISKELTMTKTLSVLLSSLSLLLPLWPCVGLIIATRFIAQR